MAEGLYATCKGKVNTINVAYDELCRSLDEYIDFLKAQAQAEETDANPDKNKIIALTMQMKGAARMRDTVESAVLDDMIRFSDRVIRIKHWEDGIFL